MSNGGGAAPALVRKGAEEPKTIDALEALQARRAFPRSDVGNAERFAFRYSYAARYAHGLGWLRWDGRRWAADEKREIEGTYAIETVRSMLQEAAAIEDYKDRAELARHALASERADRIAAMLRVAQNLPLLSVAAAEFDRDPFLFNVENGTIDLRTGELRKHSRDDLLSKLAPVRYDPSATAPTWERLVAWAMRDRPELIGFFQRALGYCLSGSVREQVWFLLQGGGRNAKTTLLEAVEDVMGDYVVRAMPDVFLGKAGHPTELAALAGSRLALAIEPEMGKPFRDGLLKAITGEARLTARRMHRDPFTFPVTFKIVIAANHRPETRDASDGFWRRVRLVPFDNQVAEGEADSGLKEKLRAEAPGILAWLVRGAVEWHTRGLGTAREVVEATQSYREEQDQIRRFVEDECALSRDAWVLTAALYSAFKGWCERNGEGHVPSSGVRRVIRVDQAACFLGAGLSAFCCSTSSSSRVMVM